LGDLGIFELDEGVAFGAGGQFGTGYFDGKDFSVLGEVGFDLVLHESVGEMSDVDDCVLNGLWRTEGQVCLLSRRGS
jgi:hypothetical protein